MKFLRNIFDSAHKTLNSSEKTKKFFPLIDAFDTLMFTPNHVTSNGSHVRDAIDLKRTMMLVIIALVPLTLDMTEILFLSSSRASCKGLLSTSL